MPLSRRPEARARQLGNLAARPPAPPPGNQRALKAGYRATAKTLPVEGKAREIYRLLADEAPLRAPDGSLPAADRTAVELLALCLARIERVAAFIGVYGPLDEAKGGAVRPAAEYELRLRREAREHAEALGLTPGSRVRLGLDVARGFDLAAARARDLEDER